MPCRSNKDIFLTNPRNKQRFIELLGCKLRDASFEVVHTQDDADLPIVKTAINFAREQNVMVVAEDTDILVLLCYYVDPTLNGILLGTEPKRGQKAKLWDIHKTKLLLGEEVCHRLPAIHALTGCDTTSKLFGIGKATALKKLKSTKHMQESLNTFCDVFASKENVLKSGSEVLSCLYGGVPFEGLDVLRFRKFGTKVAAGSISVQVQSLPPTEDAANFHIQRAYLQCRYWMTAESLDPCDWGWYISSGKLFPIKTGKSAAPSVLLKTVKCSCKTNCDSKRCSCRKNGLDCSLSCSECRGYCSNATQDDYEDDSITDD
jgi:hypothetical protein